MASIAVNAVLARTKRFHLLIMEIWDWMDRNFAGALFSARDLKPMVQHCFL
jgi:hypothetical protein